MSVFKKTFDEMAALAKQTPEVLVSYSGGKDSLAVMDICCKTFPNVKAFFWYTVPDLDYCNAQINFAKERWGVEVIQIPHWDMMMQMKEGLWCDQSPGLDKMPKIDLKMGYAYAITTCGSEHGFCATGMKDADGLPRRHFFANIRDGGNPFWKRLIHPIREWKKKDVIDYLKANNIPVPDSEEGAVTTGVGLVHDALCWLYDKHPEDFQKLLKWYPYAEAAIKRREWYGVK